MGKKLETIQKITEAKMFEDMVQVAGQLPSKHEALNSNPNTAKKKKIMA
jgi:hypothetical protein